MTLKLHQKEVNGLTYEVNIIGKELLNGHLNTVLSRPIGYMYILNTQKLNRIFGK